MATLFDPAARDNWERIYDLERSAQPVGDSGNFYSIGSIEIPILTTAPALAVQASTPTGRVSWRVGGWLQLRLDPVGEGGISPPPVLLVDRQKVWLGVATLIRWQPIRANSTYTLLFDVPDWFPDVKLVLWEYRGPDGNLNERGNVSIPLRSGQTTPDPGGGFTTVYQFPTGFGTRNFSLIGIFELGLTDRKIEALEERIGIDSIRITISTIESPRDGQFSAILAIASPN